MEHRLEVKVRDGGAGRANVVARGDGTGSTIDERPVHDPQLLEDPVTLAVETRRPRSGEDGIALELDEGEIGLHTFDDGVEESTKHGVGGRDAGVEVDPVLQLDAGMKPV
jgi:hypothetical protein